MRSNFAQITFVSWQTVLRFMRSVQRQSTRRLLLSLLWWWLSLPFPLVLPNALLLVCWLMVLLPKDYNMRLWMVMWSRGLMMRGKWLAKDHRSQYIVIEREVNKLIMHNSKNTIKCIDNRKIGYQWR